jgi:hypothetical protein
LHLLVQLAVVLVLRVRIEGGRVDRVMRNLDDRAAVGRAELLAESGVGDLEVPPDVEGVLLT